MVISTLFTLEEGDGVADELFGSASACAEF